MPDRKETKRRKMKALSLMIWTILRLSLRLKKILFKRQSGTRPPRAETWFSVERSDLGGVGVLSCLVVRGRLEKEGRKSMQAN